MQKKTAGSTALTNRGTAQLFAGVSIWDDKPIQWHAVNETGLSDKSEPGAADPSQADIPGYYNWRKVDLVIPKGRQQLESCCGLDSDKRTNWKHCGFRVRPANPSYWNAEFLPRPLLPRRRMDCRSQNTAWKNVGCAKRGYPNSFAGQENV